MREVKREFTIRITVPIMVDVVVEAVSEDEAKLCALRLPIAEVFGPQHANRLPSTAASAEKETGE